MLRAFPIAALFVLIVLTPLGRGQIERLIPQLEEFTSGKAQTAQAGDPNQPGRLLLIDVVTAYGTSRADFERKILFTASFNAGPGEYINDSLWCRVVDVDRSPNSGAMVGGNDNVEYGLAVEGGQLRWKSNSYYNSSGSPVTLVDDHLSIHNFNRWRSYRDGREVGYAHRRFAFYLEETEEHPLPVEQVDRKILMSLLIKAFESCRDAKLANVILDLSRFLPINEILEPDHGRRVLKQAKRATARSGVIPNFRRRRSARGRRRRLQAGKFDFEQAMLRSGFYDGHNPEDKPARDSRDDVYPVFRFLAESDSVPGESRALAFRRCLQIPRGTSFYPDWIKMLKEGDIPMSAQEREDTIHFLQVEIDARSPASLSLLVATLMGGFVLGIFALRFFSRRLMFAS